LALQLEGPLAMHGQVLLEVIALGLRMPALLHRRVACWEWGGGGGCGLEGRLATDVVGTHAVSSVNGVEGGFALGPK